MSAAPINMKQARSSVSDLYFYLELLSTVGPQASEEWLHSSVLAKQRCLNTRNAPSTSPSFQARRPAESVKGSFTLSPTAKELSGSNYKLANWKLSTCTPSNSSQDCDSTSSEDCDIFALTSMDFELMPATTTNLGLLFTDAAYVAFQELSVANTKDCSPKT